MCSFLYLNKCRRTFRVDIFRKKIFLPLATKFRIQIVDLTDLVPNMRVIAVLFYDVVLPVEGTGRGQACYDPVATPEPTEYGIENT